MTHIVGHIILAHTNLHRVLQLSKYLTRHGSPVVVHVDLKAPSLDFEKLHADLKTDKMVHFAERTNTEWGSMALVAATMTCAQIMVEEFPQAGHIFLTSGSCLPSRPITELHAFLSQHQGTDFIESVSVESEDWVQDGLSVERFKFYFPFSWKKQRRLFDAATWLQRKLHIVRKRPDNFVPHLGSQWWCLTRRTIQELINDPRRRAYDKYFAKSWIPDESYFQTLARKHTERLESRSLTWSKFDALGKPFLLYDDHIDIIPQSGAFMARKIWPKAELLYRELLNDQRSGTQLECPMDNETSRFFERARDVQRPAFMGKSNPGRFPTGGHAKGDKTARPYTVLMGAQLVYPHMQAWLSSNEAVLCHGNLFHQDRVEFADDANIYAGNISANRLIRNYRAPAFLANVIWNNRAHAQTFFYDLGDNQKAHDAIFKDPNARVIMIEEAWILHFLALQKTGADTRSKERLLHASAQRLNRVIARASTEAEISRYSIKEVVLNPNKYLQEIQESASQKPSPLVSIPHQSIDLEKLNDVIRHLRNAGFKLSTDVISIDDAAETPSIEKPRLVDG